MAQLLLFLVGADWGRGLKQKQKSKKNPHPLRVLTCFFLFPIYRSRVDARAFFRCAEPKKIAGVIQIISASFPKIVCVPPKRLWPHVLWTLSAATAALWQRDFLSFLTTFTKIYNGQKAKLITCVFARARDEKSSRLERFGSSQNNNKQFLGSADDEFGLICYIRAILNATTLFGFLSRRIVVTQ